MTDFKDHFSAHAEAYSQARPSYPDSLFAYLAEQAEGHACAWDAGTGSGQAAGGLARHFERVIATDASRAQLEHAPPHPKVMYVAARCRSTTGAST